MEREVDKSERMCAYRPHVCAVLDVSFLLYLTCCTYMKHQLLPMKVYTADFLLGVINLLLDLCRSEMKLCDKSVRSWCDRSSDQSSMVDPLSYISFQPVLHDWCTKGHGMCYPVSGMVHIKEPLLLI